MHFPLEIYIIVVYNFVNRFTELLFFCDAFTGNSCYMVVSKVYENPD